MVFLSKFTILENSDSVMIKVKYARVLLTKKSWIMTPSCSSQHGSSIDKAAWKIFVFDKPTVIDIKGVTKIGENHSEFIKMQEHIKIVKEAGLSLNRKFIAVFNNRFDSISITNWYKRAYPSLDGCKLVEFVFTSNHMSSHANMIKKYLTQLSDKTEVNLLINRNVHDLIKLMVDDFMKLKNLGINNSKLKYFLYWNNNFGLVRVKNKSQLLFQPALRDFGLWKRICSKITWQILFKRIRSGNYLIKWLL